jgi:hypothetical protein
MKKSKSNAIHKKVQDKDLARWMFSESDEVREIIVEARVPNRRVTIRKEDGNTGAFTDIKSSSPLKRTKVIEELDSVINGILDEPPVQLRAAGALAVRATGKQALDFVDHTLVKFIRPNRWIGKKRTMTHSLK